MSYSDPDLFPQPYYSTRVNAGDIGSRVKQLDQTTGRQQEGEGEKSKAGFWEEFDVRFDLTSYDSNCGVRSTFNISPQPRRPSPALLSAKVWSLYCHPVVELCNNTSSRLAKSML